MKVWILFLSIHTLVLTTLYSGNLTAFLTVERRQPSIETIQELHESDRSVIGIGFYFKASFEESLNTYIKDFVNRYVRWTDELDFSHQLIHGKGVYVETRTYQDYLIVTNYTYKGIASMRIMKECYQDQNIGVTLQRHFPVKESFNKVISRQSLILVWC
ncbi:glutamate receptor 2-like [Macrobrachium nipponense]|uniref:glutamate receptor 2-like n=1 Tax=Macrobrachium nipponense TaxID=159736 RepID=UPI0030C8A26E